MNLTFPEGQTFWESISEENAANHINLQNCGYNQNIKAGEKLTLKYLGQTGENTEPQNYILSYIAYAPDELEMDYDKDGLDNQTELYYGTNLYDADTDGDGLPDFFEITNGLNPLKRDTDANGIPDSEEDYDKDSLTTWEEFLAETDPWDEDTDYDSLTDGDEIKKYYTNPLMADTDEDGLEDGDEIPLGLNPLIWDTDGNGIPDSEEKLEQHLSVKIENEEKPEITQISVTMAGTGNLNTNTTITDVYETDTMSSEVEGLIGVPVDIESKAVFDEAEIIFAYDETKLGETREEDLSILWYDEENNSYTILNEESIVDTENNTVSCKVNHFSTYMVVDRAKWYEVWSSAITYRRGSNIPTTYKQYYDMAYVIDRSGSMSGSRLTTAKTSISLFLEAMLPQDRAAIIQYDSSASVRKSFTNDLEALKQTVSTIYASGGTNVNEGLKKAIELFEKEKTSKNSRLIILLCDGDVSYTSATLQKARENKIKIYTVLIGDYYYGKKDLEIIAQKTGGKSYYAATAEEIREAIYGVQRDTIAELDLTDTDKDGLPDLYETAGMLLPNGKLVCSDPLKYDTDGDGVNDGKEMGILKEFTAETKLKQLRLIARGFDNEVYAEYFDYKSRPDRKDTDTDGYDDNIDAYPLRKIGSKSYIFYEKDGDSFLKKEAKSREKKIKKKGEKVSVTALNTIDSFENAWNEMGLTKDGRVEYEISDVYMVFHGRPDYIIISDNNTYYNSMIKNLNSKKIRTLHLSSCNNGNLDWLNEEIVKKFKFTQNMAITFLKEFSEIETVKAWDGYASYYTIGGLVLETGDRFSNVEEFFYRESKFDEWSKAKNGYKREATGLITYSRKNNQIVFNPAFKWYYSNANREIIKKITEVIK